MLPHSNNPRPRRPWRRLALLCLSTAVLLVTAEAASRLFWRMFYDVSLLHPGEILYAFYPSLRDVDGERPLADDGVYDILLLGESVLHPDWGFVEPALAEHIALRGHRNARIFNLATPGHTTRDSLWKYRSLAEARFDLVVIYHGINETRMNNAPDGVFRNDYGHFPRYEQINGMAPYYKQAALALPYTLHSLALDVRARIFAEQYVITEEPREEWLVHGSTPRTVLPFTNHLSEILDLAAARGDRVLLMTFALHVPDNYSNRAFENRELDYANHEMAVERWGRPADVVATIALQNDAVRRLAASRADVLFVDQAALLNGQGRYFNDPCHLTTAGSVTFVENVMSVIPAP